MFRLLAATTLFASIAVISTAGAGAPQRDCQEVSDGQGGKDVKVQDCMGQVLDEQLDMIESVRNMVNEMEQARAFFFATTEESAASADFNKTLDLIEEDNLLAAEANEDTTDEDYDEMIAKADKQKDQKCVWDEIPELEAAGSPRDENALLDFLPPDHTNPSSKFGDGKCNSFSAFLGTDKVRLHERDQGLCVRSCVDKKDQAGNFKKKKRKKRITDRMNNGLSASFRARERLDEQTAEIALLGKAFAAGDTSCDTVEQIFDSPFYEPVRYGVLSTVHFVVLSLDATRDIADPNCDQTIAGFNGAAVCTTFQAVYWGFNMTYEALLLADEIVGLFKTDVTEQCVRKVKKDTETLLVDVSKIKGDTDDIKDDVADMKADIAAMKSLIEQNRDLLLTPQGKRDGFPLE